MATRRTGAEWCVATDVFAFQPPAGGMCPVRGRRPLVGLTLAIPQNAAGIRTLPAASLPNPNADPQAAMSAASPPLLPPEVQEVS